MLKSIKGFDLGDVRASKITSEDIVTFAKNLNQTRTPQTVLKYLPHL